MSSSVSVHSFLDDNSTDQYFIERATFRSNHLPHGIIALHRLGASSDRIDRFLKWYSPDLEDPATDVTDPRDVELLKGKRVSYYKILKHYENLLKNKYKNMEELISVEFPKLSPGLAGSALHGTIHLGYGYSVKNERVVLEGLAYIYHSYRPIVSNELLPASSFGNGDLGIFDVLANVAKDVDLRQAMLEGANQEEWSSLKIGIFQKRVGYLLTSKGDKLVGYMLTLNIPTDVRNDLGKIETVKMARTVVHWIVTAYALSERKNDFFLLHGVTCAWSLMQLMPLLGNADGVKVIQELLTVLIAVYVAQNTPAFNVPPEQLGTSPKDWADLVEKTLEKDRDEHCFKLIQVCYEMARDNCENASIYMQAAKSAFEHEEFVY